MWEIANFCLLLLLVIIVLTILIISIWYYYKVRAYVDEAISHIGSLIPTFDPYEFNDIDYSSLENIDFYSNSFSLDLSQFLCNINMSSYNIYSNFDARLDNKIKIDHTLGDSGYIYKFKHLEKDVIIFSFRGTKTADEVITDLDSVQSEMNGYPADILVHRGFYRSWIPYKDEIKNYIKSASDKDTIVLITGHSLGCSSALFTSLFVSQYCKNIQLYMFAPPRIGNQHLIKKLNEIVKNNYSIINVPDFIPTLPPMTLMTPGNTWIYENFSNRYQLDYQMGSMSLNHRLDVYLCGLDDKQKLCKDPIWKKIPVLTMNNL